MRERNIKRSNMDGTNIAVIHNNVYSFGLAVEWNPLQLYWTNYSNRSISVSDLEGNSRTTVLSKLNPRDIVVDPHQRLELNRLTFQVYFDEAGIRECHRWNQGLFDSRRSPIGSEYPVSPGHFSVVSALLGSPLGCCLSGDVHS